MSMLGRLHGIDTVPITRARVLELGCRDGENLLALAAAWPSAQLTGFEVDAALVRVAAERVTAADLDNVTLMSGALTAAARPTSDALGTFDYVIAHGLLSRLRPDDREALWTIIQRVLAPNGIALVSFDSWPGQHALEPLRRLMTFHVAQIPDPQERVRQARAIAHWQADRWFRVHGPARKVLVDRQIAMLDAMSDEQVLRELLGPIHEPLRLDDFTADAGRHGLQWLTNARPSEPRSNRSTTQIRELLSAFPDVVRQQQYLDYFIDTGFRTSLVCHAALEVRRQATVADFEPLYLAPRMDYVEDDDRPALPAASKVLLDHLRATFRAPITVSAFVDDALRGPFRDTRVAAIVGVSELYFGEAIELARTPPTLASQPPAVDDLPRATTWAQLQATMGAASATSLWHREVPLIDLERRTLTYCDGNYATDQIVEALGPDAAEALETLHRHGFLLEARA